MCVTTILASSKTIGDRHMGVCGFFLSVKFATSILVLLAREDKYAKLFFVKLTLCPAIGIFNLKNLEWQT